MNWEESKVLTQLKRDFLKAFYATQTPFFLSGGSALGIFNLDHRKSYDLDFSLCKKLLSCTVDAYGLCRKSHRDGRFAIGK